MAPKTFAPNRGGQVSAESASNHSPGNPTLVLLSFFAVYFLWGSTYFAMHVGVESIPPYLLSGIRYTTVGIFFYPAFRYLSGEQPTLAQWRTAAIVGVLLCALGNGTVSWSLRIVPSGIGALLVAMVSLWMVLIDWLRPGGRRPTLRVTIGFILGFAGMVLLVGPKTLGGSERVNLWGTVALVLASFAWALGSIYSRHHPLPRSPLLAVGMETLVGGIAGIIFSGLRGEWNHFHIANVSHVSWLSLLYLITFGSAMGFSAYAYLLKHCMASRVATYAFVNPVVALFVGWLLLNEALTLRTLLASAVILLAVILVISAPHKDEAEATEAMPAPGEA